MIKKIFILLFFVATICNAQVRRCNAALVSAGLCEASTDGLLFFNFDDVIPVPGFDNLTAEDALLLSLSWNAGWRSQIICFDIRITNEYGIITQAGSNEGDCTILEHGNTVSNPTPQARSVFLYIRHLIRQHNRRFWVTRPDIPGPPVPPEIDISPNG